MAKPADHGLRIEELENALGRPGDDGAVSVDDDRSLDEDRVGRVAPLRSFYVQVDDLQAALDKAEAAGGKTVMPPIDVPGGPKIAQFTDPQGNCIGLTSGM